MLNNKLCAVLVPAARYIEPECEDGLRELESRGYRVIRLIGLSSVDQARNILATQAIEQKCQELVWIDSDMGFNPSDVDRMRRYNKPVVVGLYSMKGKGGVAAEYLDEAPEFGLKAGLFEIRYSGMGFCYTKREVYDKMALGFCNLGRRRILPFFLPMLVDEDGERRYLPEDYAFFYRVRAHGFKVLADTGISLRHYGRHAYQIDTFSPPENFQVASKWGGRTVKPPVHVILHTRNHEREIMRCLQSVEAALSGWEWATTIVDDSTDGTVALLNKHAAGTAAKGFKVIAMEGASAAAAANKALAEFPDYPAVLFIDPTSQLMPSRLLMLKWMAESDVLLAWGAYLVSGSPARTVKADENFRTPAMCSSVVHRSLFTDTPFDETVAGDAWLDVLDRLAMKSPLKAWSGGLTAIQHLRVGRKVTSRSDSDKDAIVQFYAGAEVHPKIPCGTRFHDYDVTNTPLGLGDSLILSGLPSSAKIAGRSNRIAPPSTAFAELAPFVPDYEPAKPGSYRIAADVLQHHYDTGNGHLTQRLHRAIGLPVPLVPGARLVVPGEKVKGRVALHFCPGRHAKWQQRHIHEKARQLYPETVAGLQDFMDHHPEMEFFEVGEAPMGLVNGTRDATGTDLPSTLRLMQTCEYFIGIISGPMHMANALGCRCVVIINFPDPTKIFLPTLLDIPQVESEWFNPLNVHLHQEGEGQQVKRFSLINLERAFAGELYPYWSDRFLNLINEPL